MVTFFPKYDVYIAVPVVKECHKDRLMCELCLPNEIKKALLLVAEEPSRRSALCGSTSLANQIKASDNYRPMGRRRHRSGGYWSTCSVFTNKAQAVASLSSPRCYFGREVKYLCAQS